MLVIQKFCQVSLIYRRASIRLVKYIDFDCLTLFVYLFSCPGETGRCRSARHNAKNAQGCVLWSYNAAAKHFVDHFPKVKKNRS